jgi:hypothetical protein
VAAFLAEFRVLADFWAWWLVLKVSVAGFESERF